MSGWHKESEPCLRSRTKRQNCPLLYTNQAARTLDGPMGCAEDEIIGKYLWLGGGAVQKWYSKQHGPAKARSHFSQILDFLAKSGICELSVL